MYTITPNTFIFGTIDENKASQLNPEETYYLPDSFVSDGLPIVEKKYTASISTATEKVQKGSIEMYEVTAINEMTAEQKAVVDAQDTYKEKALNFRYNRIRISGSSKKAVEALSEMALEAVLSDFTYWSKRDYTLNANNKITGIETTIYIAVQMIELTKLEAVEAVSGIIIETLDGDDIRTQIDGVYKYLMPQ